MNYINLKRNVYGDTWGNRISMITLTAAYTEREPSAAAAAAYTAEIAQRVFASV